MNELTAPEKALLKELQHNPLWPGILEKLGTFGREIPPYRPGQSNAAEQAADWNYWSGVDRGRKDVLKRLSDG